SKGIRFAMGGIKGVGEAVVDNILQERQSAGVFSSFYNFISRIVMRKVGKKTLELVVESGCFDFTGWSRKALCVSVEPMFAAIGKEQQEKTKGIRDLFSLTNASVTEDRFSQPPEIEEELSRQVQLQREYALLGVHLNGHPLADYK